MLTTHIVVPYDRHWGHFAMEMPTVYKFRNGPPSNAYTKVGWMRLSKLCQCLTEFKLSEPDPGSVADALFIHLLENFGPLLITRIMQFDQYQNAIKLARPFLRVSHVRVCAEKGDFRPLDGEEAWKEEPHLVFVPHWWGRQIIELVTEHGMHSISSTPPSGHENLANKGYLWAYSANKQRHLEIVLNGASGPRPMWNWSRQMKPRKDD